MKQRKLHCGELMKRVNDRIEKTVNNKLLSYNLTSTQFKMLVTLDLTEGHSASLKELEKFFGTAQSTIAGIVSRLEKKGLVSAFTDPGDKRIKKIRLTDSGLQVCLNVKESIQETERQLLSGLTPEELTELNRLLQKVYDTIQ